MNNLRKQLCAALEARMKGRKAFVPEAGGVLLDAFLSLSRARSWRTHGPNPISYSEIAAWCNLMQVPLKPAHVAIIVALDEVWMTQIMTQAAPERVKTLPPISDHPISAALLDVMMG